MEDITIYEHVISPPGRIVASPGLLKGVKLLGLSSVNGHRYTRDALRKAIALYEGVKVNVDHPPRGAESAPRAYRDRLGRIERVRLSEDGLFGDLRFNPEHPQARQLVWDAEHAPENLGLSHNATGRGHRTEDAFLVEEITAVRSVDLVADPATTRGLFEAQANPPPASDNERAIREHLARLDERLDELQRYQQANQWLLTSGLPAEAVSADVFQSVLQAPDETAARRLLEDRRRIEGDRPLSRGDHPAPPAVDAKSFATRLLN